MSVEDELTRITMNQEKFLNPNLFIKRHLFLRLFVWAINLY